MVVKTVKYITTSALFRLGENPSGKAYTWLEQVAIDYLSEKAPADGNVGLECMYVNLGGSARVASLPPDCMRVSKIGLKAGTQMWTLTVNNNLRIPEEVFNCENEYDSSVGYANFGGGYGWWNNAPQYTLGGGQNTNYYRIVGRTIVFDHGIPDGQLCIEYMSNGANLSGDTMIDVTYAEPFRLYLMSEFVFHRGDREGRSKYKELQLQYEAAQWNANILANAPRMSEVIDAMAQSSEFNLG